MNEYKSLAPLIGGATTLPPLPVGPGEESAQVGLSVTQVTTILRAYWKVSLISVVGLILLSALIIRLLPKQYVATATLLVNHDTKDPLAGREVPQNMPNGVDPTYIPTQIALINSPVVLRPVVDKLKLITDPEFDTGASGTPDAVHEAVMRNLQDVVDVTQGIGSQLLYVAASSSNPNKAANLANGVAEEYLLQAQQRTNQPAGERAARYSQELQELRDKVTSAQSRITAFRKANPTIELDETKTDSDAIALADLQQKLLAAQSARRQLETQQVHESDSLLESSSIGQLRAKLEGQRAEMAELRATLGPKHPKVLELASEISATNQSLEIEKHAIADNQADQLARARQLEATYQHAIDAQQTKVVGTQATQESAAKLVLELQSAQATYKRALDGYDQIMFASAANFNDVTLVSRAVPPTKALKPNKIKLFLSAIAGSLLVGLAWPFLYELFFDRRVRCRDDLERHFGIPVLGQLSASLPPSGQLHSPA